MLDYIIKTIFTTLRLIYARVILNSNSFFLHSPEQALEFSLIVGCTFSFPVMLTENIAK
jgi:hypothetical protein